MLSTAGRVKPVVVGFMDIAQPEEPGPAASGSSAPGGRGAKLGMVFLSATGG
jgi:hypothetical protein